MRIFCAGLACLIAASCAEAPEPDSAAQVPVDPEPGRYQIALSGVGIMKHASKDEPHSYCLRGSDRTSFAHMLVKNYYLLHPACTNKRLPREGNAIAGEIRCPADPKMANGTIRYDYKGAVSQTTAKVAVQMIFDVEFKEGATAEVSPVQMKLMMKAIEQARFVIEATRTGDCR